jgi:hypothetical protein
MGGLVDRGWVLGINKTADAVPCHATCSQDGLFIGKYDPRLRKWCETGQQLFFPVDDAFHREPIPGAVYLRRRPWEEAGAWSSDPWLVVNGANSGYAGLNVALLKRAREVYLLGFDMVPPPTAKASRHWHNGYPWTSIYASGIFERWARYFDEGARQLPAGVRVLNANPASAVRGFAFTTYEALGL